MRVGTQGDLQFWTQNCCFAWHKTTGDGWNPHRLDILELSTPLCVLKTTDEFLGPIETCKSGPKVAVLHAQNHRWLLEPLETSNSGANHAFLHAQNDRRGLETIEFCNSGPKVADLHAKSTDEGWNPYRLDILVLSTQLWVLNTTH